MSNNLSYNLFQRKVKINYTAHMVVDINWELNTKFNLK